MAGGRKGDVALNLFPFMSVLISLMGILMLFLIVIVSNRVMGVQEAETASSPPPPQAELGPADGSESPASREVPRLPAQQYAETQDQIRKLTARLAQRERECAELVRMREQLRELIKMADDPTSPSSASPDTQTPGLGGLEPVRIVPDPRGRPVNKVPKLVEIQADKFILHPQKAEYGVGELPQAQSPLRKFLDGVDRARQQQYLLVLVQPNAVPTYEKLRKCLLANYNEQIEKRQELGGGIVRVLTITKTRIDIGVEPFRRDWLYVSEESAEGKAK